MSKKEHSKNSKKLTRKDFARMWGEDGPYSQVRVAEETRILDDSVSRVFLIVEAEVNPFTFEYVRAHRRDFAGDEAVQQLLDHAEDRGKYGYIISAGEVKSDDPQADDFVQVQKDMVVQTLIRMHRYVMEQCGLVHGTFSTISSNEESAFVWNDAAGKVDVVENDAVWERDTLVRSPSGVTDNKARMYFVLPFANGVPKAQDVKTFAMALKEAAAEYVVDVEDVESFQEYIFLAALIPFDVAPDDFMRKTISTVNRQKTKKLLYDMYFVTNTHKPTQEEIMRFMAGF